MATKEAEQKQMEELRGRISAMEVELAKARKQMKEALAVARKFKEFIGNMDDVINKAKLYDKGMSQLRASPKPKIIWFLVDYNIKMEKVMVGI